MENTKSKAKGWAWLIEDRRRVNELEGKSKEITQDEEEIRAQDFFKSRARGRRERGKRREERKEKSEKNQRTRVNEWDTKKLIEEMMVNFFSKFHIKHHLKV